MSHRLITISIGSWNDRFSGPYQIRVLVSKLGVPGRYMVRLHSRRSGALLREAISNESGACAFTGLQKIDQGYFVVAHDAGNDPKNAVIADWVTPEPMP